MFKKISTILLCLLASVSFAQTLDEQVMKKAIADFNEEFGESITTPEQLMVKIGAEYQNLHANINQCVSGTYTYTYLISLGGLAFPTTVIQKQPDGSCLVKTTIDLRKTGGGLLISECKYEANGRELSTNQETDTVSQRNSGLDNGSSLPLQKAQCTYTRDGQPTQPF